VTDRPRLLGSDGGADEVTPAGAVYVRIHRDRTGQYPTLSPFTWYRVTSIDPDGSAWIDAQDDDQPFNLPAAHLGSVRAGQGTTVPASWPT
jgi:hypothetical protein